MDKKNKGWIVFKLFLWFLAAGIVYKAKSLIYTDETVYDNFVKTGFSVAAIALCIVINHKLNNVQYISLYRARPLFNAILLIPFVLAIAYLYAFTHFGIIRQTSPLMLLLILTAVLTAAAAEEFIFRLLGTNYLLNRGFSLQSTAMITSALFAVAHITNIFYSDWISITNQTVLAFMLGIIMYCLNILSRSFYPGIVFHFLMNVPIGINRLANQTELVEEKNTLLSALISFLIIQLVYLPLTFSAILLYANMKKAKQPFLETPDQP